MLKSGTRPAPAGQLLIMSGKSSLMSSCEEDEGTTKYIT